MYSQFHDNNDIKLCDVQIILACSLHRELFPIPTLNFPWHKILRKSRVRQQAVITYNRCHVERRDISAIKLNRVEIAYIVPLFRRLKISTDEGEDKTEYLEYLQKVSLIIARKFKPKQRFKTAL